MACADSEIKSGKLLIRRDGPDKGMREINPCTNYWSSPDIWVEGGVSNTQAKVGVPHKVKVRVKNIGPTDVGDVYVDVWLCDYTAGPLPAGQLPPPPGTLTGSVAALAANAEAVITCAPPWTPTSAQADTNDGHLCLAANAWAELPQFDGGPLLPGRTLQVCCDSHHAQCNIAIVAAPIDDEAETDMHLMAPDDAPVMRMLLNITPVSGKVGFGLAEKRVLRSHEKFGKRKVSLSRRKPRNFFFEGKGIEPTTEAELEVDNKRGTWVRFHVGVDSNQTSGALQLFNITTRDPATGDSIGGARLMVLAL